MKILTNFFLFLISLSFLLPSCDPEFLITSETCYLLAACANGSNPIWVIEYPSLGDESPTECLCACHQYGGSSQGRCGKRCEYKLENCVSGWVISESDDGTCECYCPIGFQNPPFCNVKTGNLPTNAFKITNSTNAKRMIESVDYFPLWEGNYWKYDAYDSTGIGLVSNFAYAVTDTFTLDTLDTIKIFAFDYYFFDSLGMPNDTLLGLMLYNLPVDSNQVYSYSNSSGPFIYHSFTFGDTIAIDGPDYTVADSVGTLTVPAGTFEIVFG